MPRTPFMRTIMAAAGGLIGAGVMFAGLVLINGIDGFARCTATTGIGWLVPLVAGVVIGGISLLLLDSVPSRFPDASSDLRSSACAACGSQIMDEWRLCPHCGELLECQVSPPDAGRVPHGV